MKRKCQQVAFQRRSIHIHLQHIYNTQKIIPGLIQFLRQPALNAESDILREKLAAHQFTIDKLSTEQKNWDPYY